VLAPLGVRRRGRRDRHRRGWQGQERPRLCAGRHLGALPADRVGPPGDHRLRDAWRRRIVAEVNNGGDMAGATLRMIDPNVAFTAVRASRGKVVRAEPVAALYQQGRVHHIGTFRQLEDQMTNLPLLKNERVPHKIWPAPVH
jgi:hypothetical protein